MISKVYHDNAIGKINDNNFDRLLNDYQTEQNGIEIKIKDIKKKLEQGNDAINNLSKLRDAVDKYMNFTDLTQEMVNALISKIIIEPRKVENRVKSQEINIVYRFIEMSL